MSEPNALFSTFTQYDNAVKKLLSAVFPEGHVIYEPVNTAFEYASKQLKTTELKFPFISIFRDNTIDIDTKTSYSNYHEGIPMFKELPIYEDNGKQVGTTNRIAKNAKSLYILIGYQIDCWGIDAKSTEELVQELMFWFFENQQLSVDYYGQQLDFSFTIDNQIVNNTDLTRYNLEGKLFRYTMRVVLHASIFRSENYFTVLKPHIEIKLEK